MYYAEIIHYVSNVLKNKTNKQKKKKYTTALIVKGTSGLCVRF